MGTPKKEHSTTFIKRPTALECLAKIEPPTPDDRFLISWDSDQNLLRYGCGDGKHEIVVVSNGEIEHVKSKFGIATKLRPDCVYQFESASRQTQGLELVSKCDGLFHSYLHFQDERLYSLLTAWSIATYCYVVFSHFGYLYLHSPLPRCGKTRVEEVLSHLCFEATVPLNSPTTPAIRDTAAEGRTLVLDTLERWKDKNSEAHSAAMELLDAGFRNGGTVVKMISAGQRKWEKKAFPVYAPYVLAAIHKDSLSDTALDRSFVVEMHRKHTGIKKRKYDFHRCEKECVPLRDEVYLWTLQHVQDVAVAYDSPGLEVKINALELNDRASDIWKPLIAVSQVLGSNAMVGQLLSLAAEMGRDHDSAERERLRSIAQSLTNLANGSGLLLGMTSELIDNLRRVGISVPERELHDVLANWGIGDSRRKTYDERTGPAEFGSCKFRVYSIS